MRKVIFLFSLCVSSILTAQTTADTTAVSSLADRIFFGLKFGLNFPSMYYGDKAINDLSVDIYAKGVFEMFSEIGLNSKNTLSIRPGFKFLSRGQHISDADLDYKLDVKYTELTVPVLYTFYGKKNIHPYVLAGPVVSFVRGGTIMLDDGISLYKVRASKGNIRSTALGLYLGAGVKYDLTIRKFPFRVGAELGYHFGLTNTFSDKEVSETANALNEYNYAINGLRANRGLELGVMVAVPLSSFKSIKLPKRKPKPFPIPEPEPITETVIIEPEKPCYTIAEMKDFISQKKDIKGKKICAIKQVAFDFGKSTLTPNDKVYLDEIVDLMKQNEQISIKINGHTDNIGSEQFNMNLSRDRAKAVYDYLRSKDINESRLSYECFGYSRPITDNDTEDGRAINRRVEFEIINQ